MSIETPYEEGRRMFQNGVLLSDTWHHCSEENFEMLDEVLRGWNETKDSGAVFGEDLYTTHELRMLIKVVDADQSGELKSLQPKATYQLPRKGEFVSFDNRRYVVTEVTHNLAEECVTVTVEQHY